MPKIKVNQIELHYQEYGQGEEVLVFSHGYLMNHTMFKAQIEHFKNRYRIIAFDHRGHGESEVSESGYDLNNLVTDAICLIEALRLKNVHFIGMSTGGFVGMRIAIRRPDLLKSLVLMDTSAEAEPKAALRRNNLLLWVVKYIGWFPAIGQVMPIMFHATFLKDKNRQEQVREWRNIVTSQNRPAMVAFGKGIFARENVLEQLAEVKIPTAIIVGDNDIATPPSCSRRMAETIPGAKLYTIPDAGHSAAIEKAGEVCEAMEEFYGVIGE